MDYLSRALPLLTLIPAIRQHELSLLTLREQCLLTFSAFNRDPQKYTEDILYLLAVTIDEVVLTSRPPDWQAWQGCLLQEKLSDTHVGGERFYERLTYHQRLHHHCVLKVFLACLVMGYQGKWALYDTARKEEIIDELKKLLLEKREAVPPIDRDKTKSINNSWARPVIVAMMIVSAFFLRNELSLSSYERQILRIVGSHASSGS